jgi:hypothetical protein
VTGRKTFPTDEILVTFYEGPLAGVTGYIRARECVLRFGRLTLPVLDPRAPRGLTIYAQAKALPRGYGVPERWMPVDERGNWISDAEHYDRGDYDPGEQALPWEEYGAEGDPGGELG